MKENLPLDDSEIFTIGTQLIFDRVFKRLGYRNTFLNNGPYVVVQFQSKALNQTVEIIYDFIRSDRPYYQVYLIIKKRSLLFRKQKEIEALEYFDKREEPKSIESTLVLIEELFCQYLIPVIKGEKWIH